MVDRNRQAPEPSLFPSESTSSTEPVECLGMTFASDEARRAYFLERRVLGNRKVGALPQLGELLLEARNCFTRRQIRGFGAILTRFGSPFNLLWS